MRCIVFLVKEALKNPIDAQHIWRYFPFELSSENELEQHRLSEILQRESDFEWDQQHIDDCKNDEQFLSEQQMATLKNLQKRLQLYQKNSAGFPTIRRLVLIRALSGEVSEFLEEVTKPQTTSQS